MADNDDVRAGEELARSWLQGKSELIDSLADLVEGMSHPLGETERAFLQTIANAAQAAAKREGQPPSVVADAAPVPRSAPAAEPKVDLEEFRRRQREHERAAKLEELGRRNQALFLEQGRSRPATRGGMTRIGGDDHGGSGAPSRPSGRSPLHFDRRPKAHLKRAGKACADVAPSAIVPTIIRSAPRPHASYG